MSPLMSCKGGYSGPGTVLPCTLPPGPHCPSLLPLRSQSAWAFGPLSPRSSLHWGNPAPKAGSSWLHPPATWIQTQETAVWQPGQAPEIHQAPHQSALDTPPRHPALLPGLNVDNPPGLPWSKGEWENSSPDAHCCSPNPRWWKATSHQPPAVITTTICWVLPTSPALAQHLTELLHFMCTIWEVHSAHHYHLPIS